MTPIEVNVLLTKTGLIDPFITPDPDRAEEWSELLDDIEFESALNAVRFHYRGNDERISPSRIRYLVRQGDGDRLAKARAQFLAWAEERHGDYGIALPIPHNVTWFMAVINSGHAEAIDRAVIEMEDNLIAQGHEWLARRREVTSA